jgi:N-acetylmuramoyl-L-alanine amidase
MVAGVSGIYSDTKDSKVTDFSADKVSIKTEQRTTVTAESITANPDPIQTKEPEHKNKLEKKKKPQKEKNLVQSMDLDKDESYLLVKVAMAEAEGEDVEGKALVILVVLNRVWSKEFPDSIEEVILQHKNGCYQFSVTQKGGRWWKVEPDKECYEALELVMNGWNESGNALYFESPSKSTWHQDNLEFLFQHGNHYFYKDRE